MGRRIQGEGSVYQRKDGRWVAVITSEEGKKKFSYCKTQKEALKELQLATQAKMQGTLITTKDQKLSEFLTSWLTDTAQPILRDKTYIRYCELVRLHIIPILGKVTLQKITPQHLQRLYKTKREEGYAPQTILHIHRFLHRAFNDAVKWNLMPRNVCNLIEGPRVPKKEMQVLSHEQAHSFLEAAQGDPLETLYILALSTGMRQGELLGLQWKDIHFDNGTLQVKRKIARISNKGFVFSEPKTAKSRRNITLTATALESLKQHRRKQHEQRLAVGPEWEEYDLVFCNMLGRPIEVGNMTRRSFRPILKKAGLPIIRFHDLRHSCASLLLSLGVHPKVVQELLGHSQISITLDTYSHVLPSLQAEAAQRLDTLLSFRQQRHQS
ncbi:site-specific integrase [Dictyobacter vulcani]|uniref:Site-specific integrase n=1 Tax=Dictyobacter vulcani TaxID=2607529 RepID=A0A5J4KHG3_9CHLR|nr:site-specific integrase [Dictyobacter vulcani]GER88894.1 site-specific integrase [Dictyobacter vulcani]